MNLRPYQQEAVDAAIAFMSKCLDPCCIEAATGAGKSHIIAAIAEWLHSQTGKHILCLAPSKELIEQNYAKYPGDASYWSASVAKSMRNPVVFGTPVSVLNSIDNFAGKFSAVIIDECDLITPTVRKIIAELRRGYPNLRVIGTTATPYRMAMGYIYALDEAGNPVPEDQTNNPYFAQLVYRITAGELIAMGYLTPPLLDPPDVDRYETEGLEVNASGKFDAGQVAKVFEGRGRKTAAIVRDIYERTPDRKGVMIFAATVQHAQEVCESLPDGEYRLITSLTTGKTDRELFIADFKAKKYKFIVNVGVLTTGFDAPHVDAICIMRATESARLFQQIAGRGTRLDDEKENFLLLDYTDNIERHFPDGDLFSPDIKARQGNSDGGSVEASCPACGVVNEFTPRPNPDEHDISTDGYWVDLEGNVIDDGDGPVPGHFGRRCGGMSPFKGVMHRCDYRWTGKECPECGCHNDIAARYCADCKAELVDPNEKLRIDFQRMKADPRAMSTDKIVEFNARRHTSKAGNTCVKVYIKTPYRAFDTYFMPKRKMEWHMLISATRNNTRKPDTVTYRKDGEFFRIYAFDRKEDEIPT